MDFTSLVQTMQDIPNTVRTIESEVQNVKLYSYATLALLVYIAYKVTR
jgi:hypothetical protein